MNLPKFLDELKRRHVYKVAVAYAVVAWLLIQAASILFPTFEAPAWIMKVFVAVIALGFPCAVILAWAFELTPEGIKRAEDVSVDAPINRRTGGKLTKIIVVVAIIAAGLLIFQFTRKTTVTASANVGADSKSIAVRLPARESLRIQVYVSRRPPPPLSILLSADGDADRFAPLTRSHPLSRSHHHATHAVHVAASQLASLASGLMFTRYGGPSSCSF